MFPDRQDLRAVMARGSFSARRQGDIWFRESIRMENAVLGRVFHMNIVANGAKRIGIARSVVKEYLTTASDGRLLLMEKYKTNYYNLDVII